MAGFLLGGVVFGALGYLLAPQVCSCIANPSDVYSRTACRNGLHRM